MGTTTTFTNRSAEDVVREELESGGVVRVIANSGAKYWVVEQITTSARYAIVAFVSRGPGWVSTKLVDEEMGPHANAFPMRLFRMLDEPRHEYSRAWRERVRAHHERLKRKANPGDRIRFGVPLEFRMGGALMFRLAADEDLTFVGRNRFRTWSGMEVRIPGWRSRYDKWEVVV